jgi:hypothetical protein
MAKYILANCTAMGAVEEALSIAEELCAELEEWYDNLPEQFQSGQKGDELQAAIDTLNEAIDLLGNAQSCDDENISNYGVAYSQVVYPRSTYMSRAKRLEVGLCALQGVPAEVPDDLDTNIARQEFCDSVAQALDAFNSVEFPMR